MTTATTRILDWVKVAKLAGKHGVRYRTNAALEEFLVALAPAVPDMRPAVADIAAERQRQINVEGWTPEHDDQHDKGELAGAAATYALHDVNYVAPSHYPPRRVYAAVAEARDAVSKTEMTTTREAIRLAIGEPKAPTRWPWEASWWKPTSRRRNLVKAGALIAAEIDRLDRATLPSLPTPSATQATEENDDDQTPQLADHRGTR